MKCAQYTDSRETTALKFHYVFTVEFFGLSNTEQKDTGDHNQTIQAEFKSTNTNIDVETAIVYQMY